LIGPGMGAFWEVNPRVEGWVLVECLDIRWSG
jgi:hypothetical protein